MAAASHYALDTAQLQVAIAFDNDPFYLWHHSVLMVKLVGLWRWVVATPTHDVKIMNLSDYNVVPLSPSRPIPRPLLLSFFGFEPVTDEQMQELMCEARLVADIAVQWPVSDSHISVAPCVMFPSDESLGALKVISASCEAGIWRWSSPPAAWYVEDPIESLFAMPMDAYITAHPARFMGAQEHGWVFLDEGRRAPVDRLLPLDIPERETEKIKALMAFRAVQVQRPVAEAPGSASASAPNRMSNKRKAVEVASEVAQEGAQPDRMRTSLRGRCAR